MHPVHGCGDDERYKVCRHVCFLNTAVVIYERYEVCSHRAYNACIRYTAIVIFK